MFFRKKTDSSKGDNATIAVQWGAYYTSKKDTTYGVFRLLDFNKDAYHVQIFKERFDHLPSLDEIKALQPFVGHAPIAVGGLLNLKELTIVGHESLDDQSLEGYEVYLQEMGVDEEKIAQIHQTVMDLSTKGILHVTFSRVGDRVAITAMEEA